MRRAGRWRTGTTRLLERDIVLSTARKRRHRSATPRASWRRFQLCRQPPMQKLIESHDGGDKAGGAGSAGTTNSFRDAG